MELVAAGNLGKQDRPRLLRMGRRQAAQKQPATVRAPGPRRARCRPFVAEAKAALAEHIVADADLVDAGAIFGTGFAPFRGGPLHYAQSAPDGGPTAFAA